MHNFQSIVQACRRDPRAFAAESEAALDLTFARTADAIADTRHPIVLLAGPSGSGKTTSAAKLAQALCTHGINTHILSMDDYFLPFDPATYPRGKDGKPDLESPLCMDIPLLLGHFDAIAAGEPVQLPRYDFPTRSRVWEESRVLRPGSDEIVVVEGIHALNPLFASDHAATLYVSARADVVDGQRVIFKGTWLRLLRRLIRDTRHRGVAPEATLRLWANIRRGEKQYISPHKHCADLIIDTALPYEIPALANFFPQPYTVPTDAERRDELLLIPAALASFPVFPPDCIPPNALIREFIG